MEDYQGICGSMIGIMILGAIATLVVWYFMQQKKRVGDLRVLAETMGWSFSDLGGPDMLKSLQRFPLFREGMSRNLRNLMEGYTEGARVIVLDFIHNPINRKGMVQQTVMVVESPDLNLPEFRLQPERALQLKGGDIDFERYPEFSKRYLLQGDEAHVRAVFRPEVLDHFQRLEGINVEAAGGQMIVYRRRQRVAAKDVREFVEMGLRIARLFRR
jgi:hypothetical protein